jgi:signal transduction histidine kinase
MKYKRLAQFSIGFVILIFVSQSFLIVRLFQVNYEFLGKVINSVSQEVYTKDMNRRLGSNSSIAQPRMEIKEGNKISTEATKGYNIDSMSGFDKSNTVTLVNIAMEAYLSEINPIKLSVIDSVASILLRKENINATSYSRIVDLKSGKILDCSKAGISMSSNPFSIIQSKDIPLNFEQTKVLQLLLLNPLKAVFSQMAGMLVLSFLLSLFCIYCLYILQRTLARQKKLAQSKNDFYNQVSHEMKRPVSLVYQAIDSLLNSKAIDNVERRERYLNLSMTELHRMSSKIDMILAMSMEEEGMFKLNLTEFNLSELIAELVERFCISKLKPIDIFIDNKMGSPMIIADKDHIFQCISNLIENAIKYSGEKVRLDIRLFREVGAVCITVRDDGIGIDDKNQERIFKKFERVFADEKKHGYGIGLSYVKQIVEKHGGKISLISELDKGSEFTIRLPQ